MKISLKDYYNIFKYHGLGKYAFSRVLDTFTEVHLFDILRRTDTATIKTNYQEDKECMHYQPVYTSVCKTMLRKSNEYFTSAIKYSDSALTPAFIDLGAGCGKAVRIASESGFFKFSLGVEIDSELHDKSLKNLKTKLNAESFECDVTSPRWIEYLYSTAPHLKKEKTVAFVFNKNSYSQRIVNETLEIIDKEFNAIIYLYQNPVHSHSLVEFGYNQICHDGLPETFHKNRKWKLFCKKDT